MVPSFIVRLWVRCQIQWCLWKKTFIGVLVSDTCLVFSPSFVMQYLVSFLVFTSILLRKRKGWLVYLNCHTVSVLCLSLTVPWVELQSMIVAFPAHTHLLLSYIGFREYSVSKNYSIIFHQNIAWVLKTNVFENMVL